MIRFQMSVALSRAVLAAALLALLSAAPIAVAVGPSDGPPPGAHAAPDVTVAAEEAVRILRESTAADPLGRLDARLRMAALSPRSGEQQIVIVTSDRELDLARFGGAHQFTLPAGEHIAILQVPESAIAKLARLDGVVLVESGDPTIERERPPHAVFEPDAVAIAAQRERARSAPGWQEPEGSPGAEPIPGTAPDVEIGADVGATPDGWFDARDGHAAIEAWELGYRGEGVRVAVLDDPIDFAHPDLMGTWAVLPEGHPYAGWPQTFEPYATYLLSLQLNPATDVSHTRTAGSSFIEMYQTSPVEEREVDGEMKPTACFQPLTFTPAGGGTPASSELGTVACDYVVPESASGEVRFGHHPDAYLRQMSSDRAAPVEWAGVLIVDAETSGVYDTVYVDLDNDRDFTDEKPNTQADPLVWRDISEPPDGVPDMTGGLLSWISDGELPVPGMYLWGYDDFVPEAGRMVYLHWVYGGHGTLCASNVASQGALGLPPNAVLHFEDLGGAPEAMNLGMAPDANLVSIGSVYSGPLQAWRVAWRYATLGHDPEREDDQIQVTSNSYGFSAEDNEGTSYNSRFIDHYVRTYAPETTFMIASGNGAPGYGTVAGPSPIVAMDVAASTQMGSTGYDSAVNTSQITYGDIIPFSNRGPTSDGGNGPELAADGAYGSGASPINGYGDGREANGTWGGTSRSTPVAAGVMALVYDAFRERHDRWPRWEEAAAVMMAGARHAGYDGLTQGAGVADAADAVRIAAGLHGVYALPSEWVAGDYRGERHAAFPKLVQRGLVYSDTLTLRNDGESDIEASLSVETLRRTEHLEIDMSIDRTLEGPSSGAGPNHLIPIERETIPEGTELMVVRGVIPMEQFDVNRDNTADNTFSIQAYQHTDIDGDGALWNDRNGNDAIDLSELGDSEVAATWEGGEASYSAIEGVITQPLPEDGLMAELGWFGRACNVDPQFQDVEEKIALVERGECTFNEKLLNVQAAGAVGMLIFTDSRNRVAMGGDNTGVTIPGVMLNRDPGLALQKLLEEGTAVTAHMRPSDNPQKGLGVPQLDFEESELDEGEYMRFSQESSSRNNWAVSVHHPLERWADGIYVGISHLGRSDAVTVTDMSLRIDFYAYEPWPWAELSDGEITVPAGGEAEYQISLEVPEDAPFGGHQAAVFIDYDRGEGDEPVGDPEGYSGGYELPQQRVVVPIKANVAAAYDWDGQVTLGGDDADDRDAPYNLGAVRGTFNWNWRAESGDWRFYFIDAQSPPPGTFWLFRSFWDDPSPGNADIDTRVYGPADDPFTRAGHPDNEDEPLYDADWYGPSALELLSRSPYRHLGGGVWPFDTSSGENDDWLSAPAGAGLHEVMLHNVLFSGHGIELPFETRVGSLTMGSSGVSLFGDSCAILRFTSQMELPGFTARAFGMSEPTVLEDVAISQDVPDDRSSASFKRDVVLADEAGRFELTLRGEDDDDLDLFVLYDADGDGEFAYPAERVAEGTSEDANEDVSLSGFQPAGAYQIWVQGWSVVGEDSTFDLTIDIVTGDDILLAEDLPDSVGVGETVEIEVCADTSEFGDSAGPRSGIVTFGPGGAPRLMQVPVSWLRDGPTINLPIGYNLAASSTSPDPLDRETDRR